MRKETFQSYPIFGCGSIGFYADGCMDKSGPRLRANRKRQKALLSVLRQMRVEAEMRQSDLAHALGVPQSVVSKFESGERRLDLLELRDVCQALGISLSEFVRRFEALIE
jgi:DNA-binding XRE family transcriptional regulator